jgi:uncharacterized protein (DUF1778 family)
MRRTKSDPIQFRLPLADYAVVERMAAEKGLTPKDFVIDLTLAAVEAGQYEIEAAVRSAR